MPSCYARQTKYNQANLEMDTIRSNVSDFISNATVMGNRTDNSTWTYKDNEAEKSFLIREFGLIRLTVLGIVIMILLISTCKVVFQTFSKSIHSKRDDEY